MTGVERLWLGNHNLLPGSTAALSGRAEPFPRPLLEAGRDDAISAGPTTSGRDEPFPVPLPPKRLEGTYPFPGQLLVAGRDEPFPRPLPPKRLEGTIPFPKPLITQLDVSKSCIRGALPSNPTRLVRLHASASAGSARCRGWLNSTSWDTFRLHPST